VDPLNQTGDSFDAFLTNMQTSKISQSDGTVWDILPTFWKRNDFVPQILLDLPELIHKDFAHWEKVDVFGVCKIFLFCLHPDRCTEDAGELYRSEAAFSDEFLDLYEAIFTPDPDFSYIPTLEELEGIFSRELDQH
jgi:hypothetical protein